MEIGGVVVVSHIFVCGEADYECLLGMPFEHAARMEVKTTDEGVRWCRIHSRDGSKSVQYCGIKADEAKNRTDVYSMKFGEDLMEIEVESEGAILKISVDEGVVGCGEVVNSVEAMLMMGLTPVQQSQEAEVWTKYKPVAKKVRPVNVGLDPGVGLKVTEREEGELVTCAVPARLTKERCRTLNFGSGLSEKEKLWFIKMLEENDLALAWDNTEIGLLKPHIEGPARIHTVSHTPWNYKQILMSYAEREKAIELLKERIAAGILEPGCGAYALRWFLVKKKNGKF